MSKKLVIGCAMAVAVLFVAALIGDDFRRSVSDDIPLASPQPNPHPTERVRLYVMAPPSLKLSFAATYSVGTWSEVYKEGIYCGPYSGSDPQQKHRAARVVLPISLRWNGSAYEGEFLIDRYLPGTCRWTFSGLTLFPTNQDFIGFQGSSDDDAPKATPGILDRWIDQTSDDWCGPDPTPIPRLHGRFTCATLDYFAGYPGYVADGLLVRVPTEQRKQSLRVDVMSVSKTLTLRFHDLAAENRAAVAGH